MDDPEYRTILYRLVQGPGTLHDLRADLTNSPPGSRFHPALKVSGKLALSRTQLDQKLRILTRSGLVRRGRSPDGLALYSFSAKTAHFELRRLDHLRFIREVAQRRGRTSLVDYLGRYVIHGVPKASFVRLGQIGNSEIGWSLEARAAPALAKIERAMAELAEVIFAPFPEYAALRAQLRGVRRRPGDPDYPTPSEKEIELMGRLRKYSFLVSFVWPPDLMTPSLFPGEPRGTEAVSQSNNRRGGIGASPASDK